MRRFALDHVTNCTQRTVMAAPSRGPTYKVVLLGELGVGKTSLFRRLKDNTFDEYQTATTGIDSCTKVVKVDGETVMVRKLGVLPTALLTLRRSRRAVSII